jgi:hypothetical protein
MPIFAGNFRKIIIPIFILGFFIFPAAATAQDESPAAPLVIAEILHPPSDEPVPPLDTLILIKIDDYYVGADCYYLILLDNEPVEAKWDPDTLTFSYYPDRMLTIGEHSIEVYMTIIGGPEHQLVASGTFNVGQSGAPVSPQGTESLFDLSTTNQYTPPAVTPVSRYSTDFFNLSGRASIDAGFVELNGLGSSLRQEPENTTIFNLNGNGRTGDTNFDFRFYLTTDETKYQQPRDRLEFSVSTDDYGISVGDTTPRLNPVALDGRRVRGFSVWGDYGIFSLSLVGGEVRREVESQYDGNGVLIRRGSGSQRLWATRLGFFDRSPFSLGFTYLSGDENPADSGGTGSPGSNTVKAVDFEWDYDDGNGALRGSWATSDYNYDDPAYSDLSNETASELEAQYNIKGHSFKLRWELIDPGFISLGRLSLQRDRETWSFEDRINLWRGGLTGRLYYEKYHNNVENTLNFTTNSIRYGGQLRYRFGLRGPSLTAGYEREDRTNNAAPGAAGWIDEGTDTVTLGLQQSFEFLDAQNNISVNWRNTVRSNTANPTGDNRQDVITVSLVSKWQSGFSLDLQYGTTDNNYTGRNAFSDADRYSIRLDYTHPNRTYDIWTRWENVNANGNLATYNSNRDTLEMGVKCMLGSEWALETTIRYVNFDDNINNANDYEENSFRIMLIQIF